MESRVRDTENRLTKLEVICDSVKEDLQSNRQLTTKVVYSLIGLVAVLSGKEALVGAMGHSTPLTLAHFAMAGLTYGGLAIYLLIRSYEKPLTAGNFIMWSGFAVLASLLLRIDAGFSLEHHSLTLSFGICFLISAVLFMLGVLKACRLPRF